MQVVQEKVTLAKDVCDIAQEIIDRRSVSMVACLLAQDALSQVMLEFLKSSIWNMNRTDAAEARRLIRLQRNLNKLSETVAKEG